MRSTLQSITSMGLAMTSLVHAAPSLYPLSNSTNTSFSHWPPAAAASLTKMITANTNTSAYAIFDADNTIWHYDIEESSMPYLENLGVISRATLDPSLKLIDFKDTANYTETLYGYYSRLCEIDDMICYPWAAQVYAGLSVREVKGYIDVLMVLNGTIPTSYWDGDEVVYTEINPPQIYPGQLELINALQSANITVYIVSASQEEIVRMVVSDPKYGYNIPPENVIGVTTLLSNASTTTNTTTLTTSRQQITSGTYNQTLNLDLVFGTYLWTPATWYAGKWAAVLTYIDMWKKPILAAGDTPGSDTYMHFNVDVEKGGLKVWVNRTLEKYEALQGLIEESVRGQEENGLVVTADKGWVVVLPEEIE